MNKKNDVLQYVDETPHAGVSSFKPKNSSFIWRIDDSNSLPLSPKIVSQKLGFDTEKYLKSGLPKLKQESSYKEPISVNFTHKSSLPWESSLDILPSNVAYNGMYISKAQFIEIQNRIVDMLEVRVKTWTPWKQGTIW